MPPPTAFPKQVRSLAGPLLVSFLLAALCLMSFAWLAEEVGEGETRQIDTTVRMAVHGVAAPIWTELARALSLLGSTLVTAILGTVLTAWLVWKNQRHHAIILAATLLGAAALDGTLKLAFRRPRPQPFFDTPLPASYSFPSGHALFAVCMYLTIAWILAAEYPRARWATWTVALLLILGIGLSRIYLGVHYPTDVLGGYLAGFVWVSAIQAWTTRRLSNVKQPT